MPNLPFPIYAAKTAAQTWLRHPMQMLEETGHFLKTGLLNKTSRPKGIFFDNHTHTDFSDGQVNVAQVVDHLLNEGVGIWGLTDHNNTTGFDKVASGEYALGAIHEGVDRDGKTSYDVSVNPDGRSLVIQSSGEKGKRELIMLRSTELYTDTGEINVHGFSGRLESRKDLADSVKAAIDQGGWVSINHPDFAHGIRYCGGLIAMEKAVKAARDANGLIVVEKNGTEIFPQNYSAFRAEKAAEELGIPLITSGDAHLLDMYARSGIMFPEGTFKIAKEFARNGNAADAVEDLVADQLFMPCFNYITLSQFKRFYFIDYKKD